VQDLPQAERIVNDFHRSLDDIDRVVKVQRGIVSFSCNMTISDTLLPEILTQFKGAYPDIRIRVHEDSSPRAIECALSGQSELALAQFGEGRPDLEFETPIDDRFAIACHKSHPLARASSTTWEEVENE